MQVNLNHTLHYYTSKELEALIAELKETIKRAKVLQRERKDYDRRKR